MKLEETIFQFKVRVEHRMDIVLVDLTQALPVLNASLKQVTLHEYKKCRRLYRLTGPEVTLTCRQ